MKSITQNNQSPQVDRGFFWHNKKFISFKKITKHDRITITEDCTGLVLYPINHPFVRLDKLRSGPSSIRSCKTTRLSKVGGKDRDRGVACS